QFDPPNAAVTQARIPYVVSYRKIDDYTIEIANPRPISYFPYMLTYMLNASPAQFAKTGSWPEFAKAPSGTGPFKIIEYKPPVRGIRVPHAINYCVNRDGLVTLLNGLAEPAYGLFKKADPFFGKPKQQYTYDPVKAKALLKEAGLGQDKPIKAKIMITTSGSGQ